MKDNCISLFLSVFVIFFIQTLVFHILKKTGLYDKPDHRKLHVSPKLTSGGMLFIISWILITGFSGIIVNNFIFTAFLIIAILGLLDDVKVFSAKVKLFFHAVTGILMFYAGAGFESFLFLDNPIILCFLTVLYYVSFINIINLIDGADGLAVCVTSVILSGVLLIAQGQIFSGEILMLVICLLVFLVFNLKNSMIFMGDCGSNFLGFIIGFYILRSGFSKFMISDIIPFILLVFIPFADTLLAIIRRVMNRKSIFSADREHIHHKLLRRFSLNRMLIIMTCLQMIFTGLSVYLVRYLL